MAQPFSPNLGTSDTDDGLLYWDNTFPSNSYRVRRNAVIYVAVLRRNRTPCSLQRTREFVEKIHNSENHTSNKVGK
jgi:hypothetical protein